MVDARGEYEEVISSKSRDPAIWDRALLLSKLLTKEELLFHKECKAHERCTLCLADTIRRGRTIYPELGWKSMVTPMEGENDKRVCLMVFGVEGEGLKRVEVVTGNEFDRDNDIETGVEDTEMQEDIEYY